MVVALDAARLTIRRDGLLGEGQIRDGKLKEHQAAHAASRATQRMTAGPAGSDAIDRTDVDQVLNEAAIRADELAAEGFHAALPVRASTTSVGGSSMGGRR